MARTRVTGEVVVRWEDDATVVRLTAQIRRRYAKATATMTAAVVEIGRSIDEVHRRLSHGEWIRWVEDALPFGLRTVNNYRGLFHWSRRAAAQFRRFAHLGPTKLYLLAAAPAQRVAQLRLDRRFALRDGRRKRIGDMTAGELGQVIGGLTTIPPRRRPIGKLVQYARKKVADFGVVVEELVTRAAELEDGVADGLADKLRQLADRLDAVD